MHGEDKEAQATEEQSGNASLQIDCEETLDISMAQELYEQLLAALNDEQSIVVNASKVERVDASILQMFCVLSEAARQQELTLEWQEPSQKFKDSVHLLDLGACFGFQAA